MAFVLNVERAENQVGAPCDFGWEGADPRVWLEVAEFVQMAGEVFDCVLASLVDVCAHAAVDRQKLGAWAQLLNF